MAKLCLNKKCNYIMSDAKTVCPKCKGKKFAVGNFERK